MLQLNTLVRFIHSHSPARLSKFKKILARRPKSVPTPGLERRDCDRHGLRSKPTRAILLCPWKRHLAAFSCCLVALASSSKFLSYLYKTKKLIKKFQADSNILASPEAGRDNCLPYALAPSMLSCVSEG